MFSLLLAWISCWSQLPVVWDTITVISMGECKKDVTPVLMHWSYVFVALTHRYDITVMGLPSFHFPVDLLNMNNAIDAFDQHGLRGQSDQLMDVMEMITCMTSMYEGIAEDHPNLVNVPLCVDLALNWMLNVYDRWVQGHCSKSNYIEDSVGLVHCPSRTQWCGKSLCRHWPRQWLAADEQAASRCFNQCWFISSWLKKHVLLKGKVFNMWSATYGYVYSSFGEIGHGLSAICFCWLCHYKLGLISISPTMTHHVMFSHHQSAAPLLDNTAYSWIKPTDAYL